MWRADERCVVVTALELWTCTAILVAVQVWALWPDIMRWVRGRRPRPAFYDQEVEHG